MSELGDFRVPVRRRDLEYEGLGGLRVIRRSSPEGDVIIIDLGAQRLVLSGPDQDRIASSLVRGLQAILP